MKQIYIFLVLFFMAVATSMNAQSAVDTVFYEDFEEDPELTWQLFPMGEDTVWVNFDADGLTPDGGDDVQRQWYWDDYFVSFVDSSGTDLIDKCIRSKSWMEGFAVGNRNWFISPKTTISDNSYVLSWASGAVQLPRYMDGYSVLISTSNNDPFASPAPFADTLFRAASMLEITGTGNEITVDGFNFTPGYIHADNVTNWDYLTLFTIDDSTLLTSLLEPHSVSLAAYAGKDVYIAFCHDADDDNQIGLDKILLTKGVQSGVNNPLETAVRFRTYPNPVDNIMNVLYRLDQSAVVSLSVMDMSGKAAVNMLTNQQQDAGEYSLNILMSRLPAGAYTVSLTVNGQSVSRVVTKR